MTVRAADPSGAPLGGSWVSAFAADVLIPEPSDLVASGRTGDDGTVGLRSDAWPESSVVVVTKEGFLPAEVPIRMSVDGTDRVIEVRLSPGQAVSGRLLDRAGAPVRAVRVTAVGIGYRRRDAGRSPPSIRAYPKSGWGSAVTDDAGAFRITGVGDEPCTLYLEEGWRFDWIPDSKRAYSASYPVAAAGSMDTYHVVREAFLCFQALDHVSGTPVSAYLQGMFLPGPARCSPRDRPISLDAHGLLDDGMSTAYRGRGVYAFPVDVYEARESVEGTVTFVGYEEAPFVGAILATPASPRSPVPQVRAERSDPRPLGNVSFVAPEDFPSTDFEGLPCFVRFERDGAARSASFYADRVEEGRYRVSLPVGDYVELGIGKTKQARSGPFQVGLREGPVLELSRVEIRFMQLTVHVRDAAGRPLHGCSVTMSEDVGKREFENVGGIGYGATDQWPLQVLAPRSVLDRTGARFWLTVLKPGFRTESVQLQLQAGELSHAVSVTLSAERPE